MTIRSADVTGKTATELNVVPPAAPKREVDVSGGTTVLQVQLSAAEASSHVEKGRGTINTVNDLAGWIGVYGDVARATAKEIELTRGGSYDKTLFLKQTLGSLIVKAILLIDELDASAEDVVNEAVERL